MTDAASRTNRLKFQKQFVAPFKWSRYFDAMPASSLGKLACESFTVLGLCRPTHEVFHVALLRRSGDVSADIDVEVLHMCPPVRLNHVRPHVAGWVNGLTADQIEGMEIWVEHLTTCTQKVPSDVRSYVIRPPVRIKDDPKTGTEIYRRYSCVGFVLECYDVGAGITLLHRDYERFPRVDIQVIREVWSESAGRLENVRLREFLGLEGDGPWPVVLPGYVLKALADDTVEYIPTAADLQFNMTG